MKAFKNGEKISEKHYNVLKSIITNAEKEETQVRMYQKLTDYEVI